ncbi:MAG: NUDIX domain-containing protein [Hominimerdicola sp.]
MYLKETKISSTEIYDGKVVKLSCDDVELENGMKTKREVIHHPGGVCVVALDEEENVFLVKQFRYPFSEALTEVPAGKLEFGENHKECGMRELKEEIGATAEKFEYLGCIYPTVAYDTEIIHMYLAEGLSFGEQNLDDGEFLDVIKIPLKKAFQMVMNNELPDSKTQSAIMRAYILKNGLDK